MKSSIFLIALSACLLLVIYLMAKLFGISLRHPADDDDECGCGRGICDSQSCANNDAMIIGDPLQTIQLDDQIAKYLSPEALQALNNKATDIVLRVVEDSNEPESIDERFYHALYGSLIATGKLSQFDKFTEEVPLKKIAEIFNSLIECGYVHPATLGGIVKIELALIDNKGFTIEKDKNGAYRRVDGFGMAYKAKVKANALSHFINEWTDDVEEEKAELEQCEKILTQFNEPVSEEELNNIEYKAAYLLFVFPTDKLIEKCAASTNAEYLFLTPDQVNEVIGSDFFVDEGALSTLTVQYSCVPESFMIEDHKDVQQVA